MPIDASVYSHVQIPKFATLGEIADARQQRNQAKSLNAERDSLTAQRQAAAAKAQKEQAEADAADTDLQASIGAHQGPDGVDWDGVLKDLYPKHPKVAQALETHVSETRDKATKDHKAQLDLDIENNQAVASLLDGVTPETLQAKLPRLARYDMQTFQELRDNPTQDTINAAVNRGLSEAERSKRQKEMFDKAEKDKADAKETTLRWLTDAHTQKDVEDALSYGQANGVKVLGELGFTPDMTPEDASRRAFALKGQAITPEQRAVSDRADKAAETAANAKSYQSKDVLVNGKRATVNFDPKTGQYVDPQTGQPVANVAPIPPAASGGGLGSTDGPDAKDIAQAIIDGKQPPSLTGMYGKTAAVRGELARKGYDLTHATEDWMATQKYLGTLNGAQQTRLRQAVAFTSESLPIVRDLVTEWDSSGLPLLSKANLDAAAKGAFGQKQQSLAVRLKGQIADLTSELGTVYKGGNSSTDESLRLAAENLQGDWSKKAALDAITQIEKNLKIRQNSMTTNGPVANQGNAYAPQMGSTPEGTRREIPDHPGRFAIYRGGKWIVE